MWKKSNRNDTGAHTDWYTTQYSVSEIVGYLKEKSSLIIFDRHANLKYKYERTFWCRGYDMDIVRQNTKNTWIISERSTGYKIQFLSMNTLPCLWVKT